MPNTQETIHGFKIVKQAPAPGGRGTRVGRVVLVDRGEEYTGRQRWVTAWQGRDLTPGAGWDCEWGWGHYFDNEQKAHEDYESRVTRGY